MSNAKVLAETLGDQGYRVISGGTDTHLMLVDVFGKGILGSEAEHALGEAAITVNKNAIPYDTNPPLRPSGIRVGTPALTTRGMREAEMRTIGKWIAEALERRTDPAGTCAASADKCSSWLSSFRCTVGCESRRRFQYHRARAKALCPLALLAPSEGSLRNSPSASIAGLRGEAALALLLCSRLPALAPQFTL